MITKTILLFIFKTTLNQQLSFLQTCEQFSSEPCCHGDVYRWSHGCYTLIHDSDPEMLEMALDAMLFFNCDGELVSSSFSLF